jgi:hypothetical protein
LILGKVQNPGCGWDEALDGWRGLIGPQPCGRPPDYQPYHVRDYPAIHRPIHIDAPPRTRSSCLTPPIRVDAAPSVVRQRKMGSREQRVHVDNSL